MVLLTFGGCQGRVAVQWSAHARLKALWESRCAASCGFCSLGMCFVVDVGISNGMAHLQKGSAKK